MTAHINRVRDEVSTTDGDTIVYKIKSLQSLSPKLTILYELFRPFGIRKGQLDDLVNLIDGRTGNQLYTSSYWLFKDRNELVVSRQKKNSEYFEIAAISDFSKFPFCIKAYFEDVTTSFIFATEPNIACLDADKISFPMIFRKWEHGDSFYPLGMKQKKKLSDYFVDNKYSLLAKEKSWVLQSANKIIWLVNDRIDNRFRITQTTKKALIIEVKSY